MHVQTSMKILDPVIVEMSYEAFLGRLAPKDRLNAEKHVALCLTDSDPRHVMVWQQLACHLMALAGHSAKLNRHPPSAQFYRADGKYRMQVFAIEDESHGQLRVYCGDALDQAVKKGVLVAREDGCDVVGYLAADSGEPLMIERIDGETINPAPYFKDMLGWNRRALRITLPAGATKDQVDAVEKICQMGAKKWTK